MDDLAAFLAFLAFLNSRLDEEQRGAELVKERENRGEVPVTNWLGVPFADRMLREVEAKRAILDRHTPHQPASGGLACDWCSEDVDDRPQVAKERWPCPDVRSIAAVWSGHPEYRPDWKP